MKRETVGRYSQSAFQNLLVDVLYLGATDFDQTLDEEILKLNEFFASKSHEFKEYYKKQSKNKYLLEARWYIYENLNEK